MINKKTLQLLAKARKENKKIVLVTGVFDILHQEHINFLSKAKNEGDLLVVGLESDERVKKIKGNDRPINTQVVRSQNMDELNIADIVFILPEKFDLPQDHEKLIELIKPNVLAVSSHSSHLDKKVQIVEKYGGELKVVHQHNPEISSTIIMNAR